MNIKLVIALLVLISISCNKKNSKTLKQEFDENGNLTLEVELLNGLKNGESIHYYNQKDFKYSKSVIDWKNDTAYYQKNYNAKNTILSEGPLKRFNFKIGKWKFYDKNQHLKEIQEFIDYNGTTYLNQNWKINQKGDTIGGNYYKLIYKDTIRLNSLNRIHFFLEQPLLSNNSDLIIYLARNNDFDKQYYENDSIEFDTIKSLALRFKNRNLHQNRNHDVVFDLEAENVGKEIIAGFLMEVDKSTNVEFDSITKNTYFRHEFYVVE